MIQSWIVVLLVCLFTGCGRTPARMETPESPTGRYSAQIAIARRVLEQQEQWADRAEWEVQQAGHGWKVIAWRVEHPEAKGPKRYLPWGYSVIELDSQMSVVSYLSKG